MQKIKTMLEKILVGEEKMHGLKNAKIFPLEGERRKQPTLSFSDCWLIALSQHEGDKDKWIKNKI